MRYGPHDVSVEILPGFQDTRKFRLEIISLATGLPMLDLLACLARHSRRHRHFQFLSSILDGFFEFLILRVNEIDPSQFSCVIKMELFIGPLLLLL